MAKNKRKIKQIVLISLFIILIYCIVFSYYSPFDFYFTGEPPLIKESEHLICHYFPFSKGTFRIEKLLQKEEEALQFVCSLLKMPLPEKKINVYYFRNRNELLKFSKHFFPCFAYTVLAKKLESIKVYGIIGNGVGPWEFVHVCSIIKVSNSGDFIFHSLRLDEHLAQFVKYEYKYPKVIDYIARYFLEKGEIEDFFIKKYFFAQEDVIGSSPYEYVTVLMPLNYASSSFIGFLINEYGIEKFEEYFKSPYDSKSVEKIFNKSEELLLNEWKKYIYDLPMPVPFGIRKMLDYATNTKDLLKVETPPLFSFCRASHIDMHKRTLVVEECLKKGDYFNGARNSYALYYNYLYFGLIGPANLLKYYKVDEKGIMDFKSKITTSNTNIEKQNFLSVFIPKLKIFILNFIIAPYFYLAYSRYIDFIMITILAILLLLIFFK